MYFVNKRSLGLAIVLSSVLLVICIQSTEASSVKEESYVPANLEAGNNNNKVQHKSHRHDHKNDILKKNTEIIYGQDEDDDDDDEDSDELVANNAAETLSTSSPSSVVASSSRAPSPPQLSNNLDDESEFGTGFIKNQNDQKSSEYDDDEDYEKELFRLYGSQRYPQQYGSSQQEDDDSEVNNLLDAVAQEMAYEDYAKLSEESKEDLTPEQIERLLKMLQGSQDSDESPEVKSIKPVNLVDVSEKLMQESDYNRQLVKKEQNLDESMMPAAEVISNSIKGTLSLAQKQASHHQKDEVDTSPVELLRKQNDYLFIFVVGGCVFAGLVALIAASVCWYTVHKNSKTIILTEYGMKGGASNLGGSKISLNSGDRRLAQSAQMYHYQHQKQQMIAMEKANNDTKPDNQSDSEGETEEGDYTVYECPGLAPTGEMEVKNPLFKEEFSSNNLQAAAASSTAPPAYSSVLGTTKEDQLIQIDQATSVTTVNETVKQQSTEQPTQQQN